MYISYYDGDPEDDDSLINRVTLDEFLDENLNSTVKQNLQLAVILFKKTLLTEKEFRSLLPPDVDEKIVDFDEEG